MACIGCNAEKVFARGYCQGCYTRLRRNGTIERRNVVNSGRCSVEGCEREAFAKNLCGYHYAKNRHPLWNMWKLLCSRHAGEFPPSWGRFDGFLGDVGERPSDRHRLTRVDVSKPFAADNIEWRAPVMKEPKNSGAKTFNRPTYAREWHLSKNFGIGLTDYMAMHAAQNGQCKACGQSETAFDRMGRIRPLAVDHNHKTGAVRALLCQRCNSVIGLADDSIELLESAIAYLRSHSP